MCVKEKKQSKYWEKSSWKVLICFVTSANLSKCLSDQRRAVPFGYCVSEWYWQEGDFIKTLFFGRRILWYRNTQDVQCSFSFMSVGQGVIEKAEELMMTKQQQHITWFRKSVSPGCYCCLQQICVACLHGFLY